MRGIQGVGAGILTGIVNQILRNLAERTTFLSEIHNDTATALLGLLDSFFYTEDQIRSAGTYIRPKDIAAIAFVVNTESKRDIWIRHLGRIAEAIYRQAPDWRQKQLDVSPRDQFRV
jgi:hypothetical protein